MNKLRPILSSYLQRIGTHVMRKSFFYAFVMANVLAVASRSGPPNIDLTVVSYMVLGVLSVQVLSLLLVGIGFIFYWLNNRNLGSINLVPPGGFLVRVSGFLFTKRFFESVCQPTIDDMREEHFEALSQNRIWKARWVLVRGTYYFFAAIGLDRAFAFVSFFVKAWKSVN